MIESSIRHSACVAFALAALPIASAQTVGQQANHALGLERSQVLQLQADLDPTLPIAVGGVINERPVVLSLQPNRVLAEGFQLFERGASGTLTEVEPAPETTLTGTLLGHPDSKVAASLLDDGLYARILVGSGEYWIEPLARAVPTADLGAHVLYSSEAMLENPGVCGTESLANAKQFFGGPSLVGGGGQLAMNAGSIAELACDADYEYFLDYGSVGAVQNRITTVLNTVNLQYESEVDISHTLTAIIVQTSSSQPYTSTDAVTLLNQFRNEWEANQGGIQRDIAQLFSGKEINSSTIGIAWLGAVCSSFGYSMVQSDFNGAFASATDLSAHELGHNWNADHCSCTSFTMNPFITSANTFSPTFTIPDIVAFRDSINCLDSGGPTGPATDMFVSSLVTSAVKASKGQKNARAVVTISDDLGNPVANVTVVVQFSGSINEFVSGVTGSNGTVTLITTGSAKGKVTVNACVDSVTGGTLTYAVNSTACSGTNS